MPPHKDVIPLPAWRAERRIGRRLQPHEVPWIRHVQPVTGDTARLVNISSSGVLVETTARLQPGRRGTVVIVDAAERTLEAHGEVVRTQLVSVGQDGALIYQSAMRFPAGLDLGLPVSTSMPSVAEPLPQFPTRVEGPLTGEWLTPAKVHEAVVTNLTLGLEEMRERRSGKDLLAALLASLVATALFLFLAGGLRSLRRFLEERLLELTRHIAERFEAGGKGFVPLLWLTEGVTWAVRIAVVLGHVIVAYLWLAYVLRRFPWTRPWGEELGHFLVSTARAFGAGALRQIPDLAIVVFIALLTRFLVKLVGAFFDAIEAGRVSVSPALAETAKPTRRIAVGVLWVFALIMAFPYLPGSGTAAFQGVSVVLGVASSPRRTAVPG